MVSKQTTTRALRVVAAAIALAGLVACAPGEIEIGTTSEALSSNNSLSDNRLSYNRLSYNRLSYNRLSYNRLSYNRLSYNSLDNDMHKDAEGREILRYIAKCALFEGDSLVVETGGVTEEFPGLLGLAASWEDGPIDVPTQEAITACLLAHVNKFGVSVPISVRHASLGCPKEESDRFTRFEGAFFGNIFNPEGAMYACRSGASPAGADLSQGDRLLRVCTDSACQAFLALGNSCSDLCLSDGAGNYKDCATKSSRKKSTTVYSNPIQVWLLPASDPAAVWGQNLATIYSYYGAPEVAQGVKTTGESKW